MPTKRKYNYKKKKRSTELLDKKVGTGLNSRDKSALKQLKKDEGLSYAELIRVALRNTYPNYFKNE